MLCWFVLPQSYHAIAEWPSRKQFNPLQSSLEMSRPAEQPDFCPTASWERLWLRDRLLRRLRTFFHERDFVEVETPLLSTEVVIDRHLEPLAVDLTGDQAGNRAWLQTSPEAHMKRLMAAGGEAIFQVTRSFRDGEQGRLHNREFTIVEWYRRGDDMNQGMSLLSDLCDALLARGPAERLCYRDAFLRYVGIDPLTIKLSDLIKRTAALGIATPDDFDSGTDSDAWLDLLLVSRVEPHLGIDTPVILYDWPASQAALAQVCNEESPVAERFELYADGIELANGYHELTDAAELRRRGQEANCQREADGRHTLPEPAQLLVAMDAGLPPCTGVALGFDRLVMLAAGAASLAEVMAFPSERA